MPHIFVSSEHGAFTPDGKIDASVAKAAAINARTDAEEVVHWATKPERFAPAYYDFPAEHLPSTHPAVVADARHYRERFAPRLFANCGTVGREHVAVVKTWSGSVLGHITSARIYRHNFGGRMVSLAVQGTNGAAYYGRASWDNGSVIRLRKAKG